MSNWTTASVADGRPGRPAGGSHRVGRRVTLLALSLAVLLPVGSAVVLFPLLAGDPYDSPDAIDPATVKSVRVILRNRKELDGGDDADFLARPADVPGLLAPLRGLTPLDARPAVVGPWLGEYRIRTTGGRRGTVRFYWYRGEPRAEAAMAATGAAGMQKPTLVPGAFGLRVQVGGRWFEGGQPLAVVAAAKAAETDGTPMR